MEVVDIVREWLEKNGYDGLCNEECGCGLDDFTPCGYIKNDCLAAYKHRKEDGCACCSIDADIIFCDKKQKDESCGD
jgi:hypothetical protein